MEFTEVLYVWFVFQIQGTEFGHVKNWQLKLYGTPMTSETFQLRRKYA